MYISVALTIFYIINLHYFFSALEFHSMMLMVVPSIISAGLLGARFGIFITLINALYTIGFGYFGFDDFVSFVTRFLPGIVLTFIVVYFVGKMHYFYKQLLEELYNRSIVEQELEAKNNELKLYSERLQGEIEEKFHAERIQKKSEEKYKELVEKSGIAITIDNEDGYFVYHNNQFELLLGYSEEEIKNININDIVHRDDFEILANRRSRLISGEIKISSYETRFIMKDGSIIFVEIESSPFKQNQEIAGTHSYIKEITERKKIEKELKRSEQRFRSIYNNAILGFYRMKLDGTILMTNPHFLKQIRLQSDESLIGKKLSDLLEIDENRSVFFDLLENYHTVDGFESEWYRADETLFFGRETAWTIFDEKGNPLFIDAILEDITLKKQTEAEREQLIELLQTARTKIKVLSGLLPICSSCKRIRDEEGGWIQVEQYIGEHSEAEFSHGICPDCASRLYPGYL